MGVYDGFGDTPNQIRSEGQQINIGFSRNGDGSGTIQWSIPAPVAGCASGDQAYDGIVILVSNKPANYIDSSPKDGTYYTGDPTFGVDIHSGDKIDEARVVGAFYHDKKTTSLIVQDVAEKTPYYVSAYAVDNVARYHREGIHAYSLPTNSQEYNDSQDIPAKQDIGLDVNPITNGTRTGLLSGVDYNFSIMINGTQYDLTIEGHDAPTYPDLVAAINAQFISIMDVPRVNLDTDEQFYYDATTKKLYKWVYDTFVETDVIVDDTTPSIPILGEFWYDGDVLYEYQTSGWVQVDLITLSYDPVNPDCNTVWFDGTDTWTWVDNRWCKLTTYTQETNPLLAPVMTCSDYWYDLGDGILYHWDVDAKYWAEADVIYNASDPNTIGVGDYWYNSTTNIMTVMVNSVWSDLANIEYVEPNPNGELDSPQGSQYWFIPSEQTFYQRNAENTAWAELAYTLAPNDPTVRSGCNLWWNSSPSIDELYAWDEQSSVWLSVGTFTQSEIDPALPPEIPTNSIWYNPITGVMQRILAVDCSYVNVEYIDYPTDPTLLPAHVTWRDSDGNFNISDGNGGWISIDPILSSTNPYILTVGDLWYNESNARLSWWDGTTWTIISCELTPTYPEDGIIVLNDIDELLYMWNGTTWIKTKPLAEVFLVRATKSTEYNSLRFLTTDRGCDTSIEIIVESGNLFTKLDSSVVYYEPLDGNSRLEKSPTWNALGIGDDGSPDERRELHTIIRNRLGYPSQKVELTPDQIDEAINSALLMLRKYSGFGYHRCMFFLDLKPNQQRYVLTNRCVGFNKITSINNIYRMRSGFMSGNVSRGGFDVFGYAALLHLYKTGTFDMLSYHLVSSYIETMQILFADHITYNWIEHIRELRLYHIAYDTERVLLDANIERTEQEIFTNRETREWIKKWAMSECKLILSQVRGKYQTLPGPNGSTTLNSQELLTQAESEQAQLLEDLSDNSMQNLGEVGLGAHFIMG